MQNLTASGRSALIKLASSLPAGSPERKTILGRILSASAYDGKIVGREWRLTWGRHAITLQELPAKGKRKLRVGKIYVYSQADAMMPVNLIEYHGKVQATDSFQQVVDKISGALVLARNSVLRDGRPMEPLPEWDIEMVHYLKVEPENAGPFNAPGADFTVSCSWLEFEAYSPRSDLSLSDPHYTIIKSSSSVAARKLYQILKTDPNALKSVSWDGFDEFLKSNKIGFKYEFSVWR